MKKDFKNKLKTFLQFILNPRLLLCLGIACLITNGWSYILFGFGTYYQIPWMVAVASAYLTFLWLPISPEKIFTAAIALTLSLRDSVRLSCESRSCLDRGSSLSHFPLWKQLFHYKNKKGLSGMLVTAFQTVLFLL